VSASGGFTVLVVDDDPGMRLTVAANLEEAGARVLCASSGDEALQVLAREPDIDLLLTDVRMPGMSGVDLWQHVHELRPDLPGVLMTAFSGERTVQRALDGGVYAVLHKPFDIDAALGVVRRAIKRPGALVLEGPDGPLGAALGAQAPVLRTTDLDGARDQLGNADVIVTDLPGVSWADIRALQGAAPGLVGVVVVSSAPAPADRAVGWVQLAPPVSPAVLRRVVADMRGG
jgi:CheY-like chemotaxis protein